MKYLMCNLKSNKTLKEILEYKEALKKVDFKDVEFVLFPSSLYLPFFYDAPYKIGSQNISIYKDGPHTGEILATQLKSVNVNFVLVNHAEIEETTEQIIRKIENASLEQLKVVLCIGEEQQTENTKTIQEIKNQIDKIFSHLKIAEQKNIILAYEPKWAINTENTINKTTLENIIIRIKDYLKIRYKIDISIIYGGGMNVTNFNNFLKIDKLDGFLIGHCGNNPDNIVKLLEKM